jgi:glutamine synthetase
VAVEKDDVASWLAENSIHTVRVEGTNLDGSLVGKMVSPAKFLSALDTGVALIDLVFGVDLQNVPYWGFAMPEWRGNLPDIFMKPDLRTLVVWEPGVAAVISDFVLGDGSPIPVCPRSLLKRQVDGLAEAGFGAIAAIEIEATVFEESIQDARKSGYQGLSPLGGRSGFAYHLAKSNDWYEYMHAVTRRLDELGIAWEAWNDEAAIGQIELNLPPASPVSVADDWTRTRQVMREVAFTLGRSVTFMAKWCGEYGQATHINLSLTADGGNAFYDPDGPSPVMRHFIGGVMATLAGATSFSLPWITSYRRLRDLEGPPTTVTWGIRNKSTAIRAMTEHPKASRIEYRTPGADSNAYLVTSVVMASGLAGIQQAIEPPPATEVMAWSNTGSIERLPDSITKAVEALNRDGLLRECLGDDFVDYWIGTRRWEWWAFHTMGGDPDVQVCPWESTRYFELV